MNSCAKSIRFFMDGQKNVFEFTSFTHNYIWLELREIEKKKTKKMVKTFSADEDYGLKPIVHRW